MRVEMYNQLSRKEGKMKKEKKEGKKAEYKKPILTKHKKLRDVTAGGTIHPA